MKNYDDPGYKVQKYGTQIVSDIELLSIITSKSVDKIRKANLSLNDLAKSNYHDLIRMGYSRSTSLKIMSSFELSRRRQIQETERKIKITSSKDAYNIFSPMLSDLPHEEFWILILDRGNNVIDKFCLSKGGINGTIVDVRMLLKRAIEKLASGLIICHNHPSGNNQPSDQDKKITTNVQNAANYMEINLLDHVIISEKSFFSFADEGIL